MNETFDEACSLVEHELDPIRTNGWKEMIDRIRAAHEREVAAKDAEIARLKAVLKPVMECNPDMEYSDYHCTIAVRESQRIAKKGGVA